MPAQPPWLQVGSVFLAMWHVRGVQGGPFVFEEGRWLCVCMGPLQSDLSETAAARPNQTRVAVMVLACCQGPAQADSRIMSGFFELFTTSPVQTNIRNMDPGKFGSTQSSGARAVRQTARRLDDAERFKVRQNVMRGGQAITGGDTENPDPNLLKGFRQPGSPAERIRGGSSQACEELAHRCDLRPAVRSKQAPSALLQSRCSPRPLARRAPRATPAAGVTPTPCRGALGRRAAPLASGRAPGRA